MQTILKALLITSSVILSLMLSGQTQAGLITVQSSQQFGVKLAGFNTAEDPVTDLAATLFLDFATPNINGTLQQVEVTVAGKHVLKTAVLGIDGNRDLQIDTAAASLAGLELELAAGGSNQTQPLSDLFDNTECTGLIACFSAQGQLALFKNSFIIDDPLALAEVISSDLLFLVSSTLFTAGPVCNAEFGENFCLSASLAKAFGVIDVAYTFKVIEPSPVLLMIIGAGLLWWRRQHGARLQVR